jgi:hypothetical protein
VLLRGLSCLRYDQLGQYRAPTPRRDMPHFSVSLTVFNLKVSHLRRVLRTQESFRIIQHTDEVRHNTQERRRVAEVPDKQTLETQAFTKSLIINRILLQEKPAADGLELVHGSKYKEHALHLGAPLPAPYRPSRTDWRIGHRHAMHDNQNHLSIISR